MALEQVHVEPSFVDANLMVDQEVDRTEGKSVTRDIKSSSSAAEKEPIVADKKSKKCQKSHKNEKPEKRKHKMNKKKVVSDVSSDTDSTSESDESTSEESSESDRASRRHRRSKHATKTRRRAKKATSEDSSSESSEDDEPIKKRKSKRHVKVTTDEESDAAGLPDAGADTEVEALKARIAAMNTELGLLEISKSLTPKVVAKPSQKGSSSGSSGSKKKKKSSYKRVDQLWDTTIHNFKLKETAQEDDSEFAEYAFVVRRRFDFEGQYLFTVVDIKSRELKLALSEVMKECKSISLDAEEPVIDPNLLFLYVEQMRTYYKKTLKAEIKAAHKKKKLVKKLEGRRALLKSLIDYIDEDYADVKKTLLPLIEAGNITFELAWALFKPNELIVTSTYGVWDEPRCFKVDYANKAASLSRGEYYSLEGRYMEYDGKTFGMGDFEIDIEAFKGVRKISSLAAYPLKYHRQEEAIRKQIIERGRRFVEAEGMNYRIHKGLAFMKKKKQVLRININGRVMVDPLTFRRINANYQTSVLKAKDGDDLFSDDSDSCSCDSDDDEQGHNDNHGDRDDGPKTKYEWVRDDKGNYVKAPVEVDEDGNRVRMQKLEQLDTILKFTEEELLLTSSVVLGFAFSEKLWLEFTLSGIKEIEYNEAAFDSLVLPAQQKSIVKALVESHKLNAAKTIDDVVQGKGRSLVCVLHGSPGTGKTLTAESISELLHAPLYSVTAGELGTDPARLELELQRILDVAHCWGAILLLDEADVFLERRDSNDVHRNALVSIFLRLLEYFQGILFLTTNRITSFDEAFQSRIHVGLKYSELTAKAKKQVWKMFFDMCKKQDGCAVDELSDGQLDDLARHNLNGRQIKNVVRTSQALALNENKALSLEIVKRVLDVQDAFDRDMNGASPEAMRAYT